MSNYIYKSSKNKKPKWQKKFFFKKFKWVKLFNNIFIYLKKVTFFKKLKGYFNESKILWHCILRNYGLESKDINKIYVKKVGHTKFFFLLQKFETRLTTLLFRARFFHRIANAFNAIRLNLIIVNGIIITNTNFLLQPLDLFQKRRNSEFLKKNIRKNNFSRRKFRLKWRKYRWKQARFIFWQIRRLSNFNLFLSKKKNSCLNFLEINYKIPAAVLLRFPLTSEILFNKQSKLSNINFWKKIYFVF